MQTQHTPSINGQNVNGSILGKKFNIYSLLRFALPSIGMILVISLYTIIDGMFIGQYAGSSALASSNIVYPVINLFLGFSIMLASGSSAIVAQFLGKGEKIKAARSFSMFTTFGFLMSTLFAIIFLIFYQPVLLFLGASPALFLDAKDYLFSMVAFVPFMTLMFIFNAFYIVDGNPHKGFFVSILSGILNILLDYYFLAILDMGIFGAGIATGISYTFAAIFGIIYFARFSHIVHLKSFQWKHSAILKALANGSSEMVTECSVGITTFVFNLTALRLIGEDGVAAITIIIYAEYLLVSFLIGFTNGVAPIFSYQFGARNFQELLRLLKMALVTIFFFSIFVFFLAQFSSSLIIEAFLPDKGHAYEITMYGFFIFSFSFLFHGFNSFTSGFLTALSESRLSALCSFMRNFLSLLIFLFILPRFLGIDGMWLAVPLADIVSLVFSFYLLYLKKEDFENAILKYRKKKLNFNMLDMKLN